MECHICGKEFGKGDKCQNCGADKVAALGEFEGFSNAYQGASHVASSSRVERLHKEAASTTRICWKCNEIIPADALYCPICRTRLERECPKCRRSYSSQYDNCPYCGTNHIEYEKGSSIKREWVTKIDDELGPFPIRKHQIIEQKVEKEKTAQEDWNKKQKQLQRQQTRQEMADAIRRREDEHKKIPIRISTASRVLCFFVASVLFIGSFVAIGLFCSFVLFPAPPPSAPVAAAPGSSFTLLAFILSGVLTFFLSKKFNSIWRKKRIADMEQFLFWRRFPKNEQRILTVEGKSASIIFEDRHGKGMARYIPEIASIRVVENSYFIIKTGERQIKEILFAFNDLLSYQSLQCESGDYQEGLWIGLASEIKFKTLSAVDIVSITITYTE